MSGNNSNSTPQEPIKKHPYYGGGRKKLSPEDKKASKRKIQKKYKEGKKFWQANVSEEKFESAEKMKQYLGMRTNTELFYWLLERGQNSIIRMGGGKL